MPMPGAAGRLGDEHPGEPDLGEALPHVVDHRGVVVVGPDVGERRAVGQVAADRVAQQLLVVGELEVHAARSSGWRAGT